MCDKDWNKKSDHCHGFFNIGCPCPYNVTFGFELMLASESEHNFFRFLQCHNVDINSLKGVLNDAACKLLPYVLNREPGLLYLKQCLVDTSHWTAMKKMKRPNNKGKGGHTGCAESFNFNNYDEHKTNNSQSREETHAVLQKVSEALRAKSYDNFFFGLIAFFGIRNLSNMNLI